jgi:hypothetical protein
VEYFSIVKVVEEDEREKSKAEKILEETIEYLILEELSTHLATYFNEFKHNDKLIKEYSRNDFPEILLQNRIINLLSTPFEDRAIFTKAGMTKNPEEGEIVSIYGNDGSRFSKFDLVLPAGSTVSRIDDGLLLIENSRISLLIAIIYEGWGANFPPGFEYNYCGKIEENLDLYGLQIILNYTIKPKALLYGSKWNYHNWIDSFIDRLVEFASFDDFLKKIDWESNLTDIIIKNQRQKFLKEQASKNQSQRLNRDKK